MRCVCECTRYSILDRVKFFAEMGLISKQLLQSQCYRRSGRVSGVLVYDDTGKYGGVPRSLLLEMVATVLFESASDFK